MSEKIENKSNENESKEVNPYNADPVVQLYIHFHFCDEPYFGVKNFAKEVADIAIKYCSTNQRNRALDIGCATGRTSFELSKYFNFVTGIDYAEKLIEVALELQNNKKLEWDILNHGLIKDKHKITINDLNLTEEHLKKIEFAAGDAHHIDDKYNNYDLVIACNLIDRLHTPLLFLDNIHKRMNKNGLLFIIDPYTWLEEYTDVSKWIGGKYIVDKNGNKIEYKTEDALKDVLKNQFNFVKDLDIPFVIRETKRKYQHSISHCTIWQKK